MDSAPRASRRVPSARTVMMVDDVFEPVRQRRPMPPVFVTVPNVVVTGAWVGTAVGVGVIATVAVAVGDGVTAVVSDVSGNSVVVLDWDVTSGGDVSVLVGIVVAVGSTARITAVVAVGSTDGTTTSVAVGITAGGGNVEVAVGSTVRDGWLSCEIGSKGRLMKVTLAGAVMTCETSGFVFGATPTNADVSSVTVTVAP